MREAFPAQLGAMYTREDNVVEEADATEILEERKSAGRNVRQRVDMETGEIVDEAAAPAQGASPAPAENADSKKAPF